jgi:hypothetical protein
MATACRPQVTCEFHDNQKPVGARFDQAQASTDGGAVLLKALDERLQLTARMAACLLDRRDPDKIRHSMRDLFGNGSSAWSVGTRTRTTRPGWRPIRCTNWQWAVIR